MKSEKDIFGLMAEFSDKEELLKAAAQAHDHGYRKMDAYTPFPVEGLAEALGFKKSLVPFFVLLAGIAGGTGGYFMQWYAMAVDYPLNIGGRPFNSWPAFVPITFELTILGAAICAILAMLVLNRLPRLNHPVFNVPNFQRASTDKFFLCIKSTDPKFDNNATKNFLESLKPDSVTEVLV